MLQKNHPPHLESLTSTGGVYVLLLRIDQSSTVEVGRKGIFDFTPGWYTYIGTAHGSGGLQSRLSRHVRRLGNNKRPRWNIDYVREHAVVEEVWFAELPAEAECRWSLALSRLSDTSVPAPGLGSGDCNVCPAHFYKLSRKLPASLLRSIAGVDANSLIAREVEPKLTTKTKLEWEQDYWAGRRIRSTSASSASFSCVNSASSRALRNTFPCIINSLGVVVQAVC